MGLKQNLKQRVQLARSVDEVVVKPGVLGGSYTFKSNHENSATSMGKLDIASLKKQVIQTGFPPTVFKLHLFHYLFDALVLIILAIPFYPEKLKKKLRIKSLSSSDSTLPIL